MASITIRPGSPPDSNTLSTLGAVSDSESSHASLRVNGDRPRSLFMSKNGQVASSPSRMRTYPEASTQCGDDISRDTRDKEQADAFEVPSLRTQLSASTAGRDEWVSPGPISFDASTELVAYSVTVDTSVSDPSLFEVVVTEPRHWLVTRTIDAVIGPRDLSWSLVYYDPSPQPLAQQARCDQNGCQLNLVALFRPRRDDWWIPIVRPTAAAPLDLLKQHSTNVEIEQINITEMSGLLGEQNPSGNLTLRIEGEANTTQAALAILVYPEDDFEWAIPRLRTDDGQTPQSYRWFNLECDEQRCVRDVEVTWDLPNRTEPIPLEYWITVIGGIGDGLASRQPPSITIEK